MCVGYLVWSTGEQQLFHLPPHELARIGSKRAVLSDGWKREVVFFYSVPDTTRDNYIQLYIHTTHAPFPKGQQRHLKHSSETPTFQ
jgi:hypothetical protein